MFSGQLSSHWASTGCCLPCALGTFDDCPWEGKCPYCNLDPAHVASTTTVSPNDPYSQAGGCKGPVTSQLCSHGVCVSRERHQASVSGASMWCRVWFCLREHLCVLISLIWTPTSCPTTPHLSPTLGSSHPLCAPTEQYFFLNNTLVCKFQICLQ